ncbi:MAG: hypothetical protein GYB67_02440, partial [Chloroflexi bacterium]|nr:hypothetical protein [Chloroflexota bacterium]
QVTIPPGLFPPGAPPPNPGQFQPFPPGVRVTRFPSPAPLPTRAPATPVIDRRVWHSSP